MTTLKVRLSTLQAQGWQVYSHTLTTAQTYLWGVTFALPFLLLAGGTYRVFLLPRAVLLDHTGLILLNHYPFSVNILACFENCREVLKTRAYRTELEGARGFLLLAFIVSDKSIHIAALCSRKVL